MTADPGAGLRRTARVVVALNLAGFFDYMADKSSADPEPKKKDDGTFWWQQDRKTAAALRGLAERSKASIPDF